MTFTTFSTSPDQAAARSPAAVRRATPTICHVLHSLGVGGGEVLAARMARRLCDRYRFVFACLDELGTLGEQLRGDGFAVHVLDRRPGVDWRCARRFAALVRTESIDVAHAHQYAPFFYAAMARVPGGRWPIVFTEHGRTFPDFRRKKRVLINRLLLRRRDRAIGVGWAVGHALVANEGLPASRVEVVYNGIDLTPYEHAASPAREFWCEFGVDPADLIILQVARLDPLKDHRTAIRTLERVVRSGIAACLVIVGAGGERGAIEAEIAQRGVGDRVKLLGLRQDVPRLLQSADLALLTSVSEGIPLTLIEAMAAGVPVVSTNVGGVPEVVIHGETGLLANAGDDAALAVAVESLAANVSLRQRMGEAGRLRARAIFSEDRMIADYDRLYRECGNDNR